MGILNKIFKTKSATPVPESAPITSTVSADRVYQIMREVAQPYVANANFVQLFNSVPEVFWPVNFIASRAAGAKYVLRRFKDDSIVWRNKEINQMLVQPNAFSSWYDTLWKHFAYKLVIVGSECPSLFVVLSITS